MSDPVSTLNQATAHIGQSIRIEDSSGLSDSEIETQEDLREQLTGQGFDVTQATISRDIKELRLVKRAADGAYQKPGVPPGGGRGGEEGVRRADPRCSLAPFACVLKSINNDKVYA